MMLKCCIAQRLCVGDSVDKFKASCSLRGLAVAACCYHLCQRKHYISLDPGSLLYSVIVLWSKLLNLVTNAILAVSMARVTVKNITRYKHIANLASNKKLVLPVPAFNVINKGSHVGNKLAMQEAMKIGVEVYHNLKDKLLDHTSVTRLFTNAKHLGLLAAGLTGDTKTLVNQARNEVAKFCFKFGYEMLVDVLARWRVLFYLLLLLH